MPLVKSYFHILGASLWKERKKQKVTLNRGTHRYPFRFRAPETGFNGQKLPTTFCRISNSKSTFFKILYHAAAIIVQPFPYFNITTPRTEILMKESIATQQRTLQMVKNSWGRPVMIRTKKKFLLHSGRAFFDVQMNKSWYNLGEDMKLTLTVDNTNSQGKVHSVAVTIQEIVGDGRGCRKVLKRGARDKLGRAMVFPLQVQGLEKQNVEIIYPVRCEHLQGSSLFNSVSFRQFYLLVVTFNMPFGVIDPEIKIPLAITNL